ncbi:MAG: NAD(P)/FAD-dependent oxidoreductase [Rhodospirillales bacterium]|jgi:thioredoxin reductase
MTALAPAPSHEVVVVGAGPAGMAAAATCARLGLDTVLLDEQPGPGGQIWRGITATPVRRGTILGSDYWDGARPADDLAASGARHVRGATVWSLSRDLEIGVTVGGAARPVGARHVILATGALERPFPVPGWTLPGVMTAGAAQILLKTSGLVPDGPTVMAGTGPLLWLLASQILAAGGRVDAILDTTPKGNRARAARHLWPFLRSPYLTKGLALLLAVRRRVPVVAGVTDLRIEGDGRAERVAFRAGGRARTMPAGLVLLHQGVVPNTNLAMAAGVSHRWDDEQLCWVPVLDADGRTDVPGVAVAGDGAGIGGVWAAVARGRIAAFAALRALRPTASVGPSEEEVAARTDLARHMAGRRFVDLLYRPGAETRIPSGDTVVCRCEEVTAAAIVEAVGQGVQGPNQMKAFLRCGMGPCQGRLCGLTVTELVADARGVPPDAVGHYRIRPPVKPVTVAEIAAMPQTEAAVKAVVRG